MKISIITACFNSVTTISDTINSVIRQKYPDIEYLIIDGGSVDGTIELIKSFDKRIDYFISEPDKGIYDALNKGLNAATGEIIGFLHSDDFYADETILEQVAESFMKHKTDSVYGDIQYISRKNPYKIIRTWKSGVFNQRKLIKGWMPPHPSFFVKKTIYDQFGSFDTSFSIAADYDMIIRLLGVNGISTHYIPEVLVKMRTGGKSNRSVSGIIQKTLEDIKALKKNKTGNVFTIPLKNIRKISQFFTHS